MSTVAEAPKPKSFVRDFTASIVVFRREVWLVVGGFTKSRTLAVAHAFLCTSCFIEARWRLRLVPAHILQAWRGALQA